MSLSPDQRRHVRRWVLNSQQELLERATRAVDETPAFYNAVKRVQGRDGDVSRTQLSALLNMARTQNARDIYTFIKQRAERREEVGKTAEADFWKSLLAERRGLEEIAQNAAQACDLAGEEGEIEPYIVSAYLEHFVAHCRYRTQYIIEEIDS